MSEQNFDITIIGGSYAGMTAALALAGIDESLKIAVIEKQDIRNQDKKRDGRAYAISSASLQLFKEIGIYDATTEQAGKISDIKITDNKSPFVLDFIGSDVDNKDGKLGQIIESYHIHNALRNRILQQKNITIFCPNSYQKITFAENMLRQHFDKLSATAQHDADGYAESSGSHAELVEALVKVKLDDETILKSKLLLACDGRFSKLRELYQIPTAQKNYHQIAIVFNIWHERSHENIAWEKFLPGGPLAILPFKNQHESSIVWIVKEDLAPAILSLDEENFSQQLRKKMEECLGEVRVISEKFSYPLIAVKAEKFYHEKMLLIGDAACGVHPIAGQGFNLAIVGIKILRDLIRNNLLCGLDVAGFSLIDDYNKKARSSARKMLIATDVLNSLFETKSLPISAMRDLGLGLVNKIPRLKKFFIKNAGGF